METYDAIIVGAGPAGLTAAAYLGRFRRRALVLDGGVPRAAWIPESHNTPGFPEGVSGRELLERLSDQARRYGAKIRPGRAEAMERAREGFEFVLDGGPARASFALLATGIVDRKPDIEGLDQAILRGLVRVCPICDAYEAIDKAIAVIGDGDLGGREAAFLRTYSDRVTLLHCGDPFGPAKLRALREKGIEALNIATGALSLDETRVWLGDAAGGARRAFDCLYLAFGCDAADSLALKWGAAHDEDQNLIVNAHQQTSINGLYAAGDFVRGLNQIAVATAEAAIAATDIHNRLRA